MKVVNNTAFEATAMPFLGPDDQHVVTVIVKGTFTVAPDAAVTIAEQQLPIAYGEEFYEEPATSVKFESDAVPFKPRADIALVGNAYTPGGKPQTTLDVALRVGDTGKTIRVFGSRHWICGGRMLPTTFSDPQPFQVVDLVYGRAFGGIDEVGGGFFKYNPEGRGFFVQKSKKAMNDAPLPNLEDPRKLIKSWKDHPLPACFGFWNKAWQPRLKYLGTYDEAWQKERCPLPPLDFNFKHYNAAHPDLQVKGYLTGNEEVELTNLTPAGTQKFVLPGIRPQCQLEVRDGESTSLDDVVLKLDTLCFIPEDNEFYQVWRGTYPIQELAAQEIGDISVDVI